MRVFRVGRDGYNVGFTRLKDDASQSTVASGWLKKDSTEHGGVNACKIWKRVVERENLSRADEGKVTD